MRLPHQSAKDKTGAGELQEWLDQVLYPAVFSHLERVLPEFGWRRQDKCWVATQWPANFPEAVEHPNPGRLVVYDDSPAFVKIHGRGVVRVLHLISGEPNPRGQVFKDAVRELAKRADVDASFLDRELSHEDQARVQARDEKRAALQLAADVANERLLSGDGEAARAYLLGRGLAIEDIKALGLGLYDVATVRKALNDSGLPHDACSSVIFQKLDGYLVVPWADACGYPLTLYGRWPGEAPAGKQKTMALPGEGTKSSPLCLNRALHAGYRTIVAVEGLFDVLLLQAVGEIRTVAYVAAQFDTNQLDTLVRAGIEQVILCGDPDVGGDKGTERNVINLEARGIRALVMPRLSDGLDPDELVLRDGLEAWRDRVAAAIPGRLWQAQQALVSITPNSSENARRKAFKALRPILGREGPDGAQGREAVVDFVVKRMGSRLEIVRSRLRSSLDADRAKLPPLDPWKYRCTDMGNGERLVAHHGSDLRYCASWGRWLVWDGRRWVDDALGVVKQRAKATVRRIYHEASAIKGADERHQNRRKELANWASKSEARDRLEAMIHLAQSEPGIAVTPQELDADPWLLNCSNGTVDLRTGEVLPYQREDLITKLAPLIYDPKAEAPTFLAFLDKITASDRELQGFLQRFFGYALTGVIREHVLINCHGHGSNGKSTLLGTFLAMMGEYGHQAPADLLLAKKGETHPTDQAGLFGKRLVVCMETPAGRAMDESRMKALTGGDLVTARRMREDYWTFAPTHKLVIGTNHRPSVRTTDHGTWRRQKLVPFTVTIPDAEQDKELPEKLRAEFSGILNWALEGCLAWQRDGLGEPKAVSEATKAWRKDSDPLGAFLNTDCELDKDHAETASALYTRYLRFIASEDEPLSKQNFGRCLAERGFQQERTSKERSWKGLRLKPIFLVGPAAPAPSGETGEQGELQKPRIMPALGDSDGSMTVTADLNRPEKASHKKTPEVTVTDASSSSGGEVPDPLALAQENPSDEPENEVFDEDDPGDGPALSRPRSLRPQTHLEEVTIAATGRGASWRS